MEPSPFNKTTEWGHHVEEIFELYYDRSWSLKKVSQWMQDHHGLVKSERQYKVLFSKSGKGKNADPATYKFIENRVSKRRREGKQSDVFIWNKLISPEKLEKEFERYAKITIRPIRSPSPSYVTVKTPLTASGSHQSSSPHVAADYDVEPDGSFVWPSDGDNLPAGQGEDDGNLEIYVPQQYMGDFDQGNLENLTLQLRQAWLSGIPFAVQISRGEVLSSNIPLHMPSTQGDLLDPIMKSIPRSPELPWIWESLTMVIASIADFRALEDVQWAPRNGTNLATHLGMLSKGDLLNILVSIVLNGTSYRKFRTRILDWLSHGRQLRFLQTLLNGSIQHVSRIRDMALALVLIPVNDRTVGGTGVTTVAAQALLSLGKQNLTTWETRGLFDAAKYLVIPDVLLRVISYRESLIGSDTRSSFLVEAVLMQSPQLVEAVLRTGADPQQALQEAMASYYAVTASNAEAAALETIVALLLWRGADPNIIIKDTWPLTMAEAGGLRSSKLLKLFQPLLSEPTSLDVIYVLGGLRDVDNLRNVSEVARQVILLVAAQRNDVDLAGRLIQVNTDTNLSLLVKSSPYGKSWEDINMSSNFWPFPGRHRQGSPVQAAARRGAPRFGDRPIDLAFQRADMSFTRLLLEAGSQPPSPLIELSELIDGSKAAKSIKGCSLERHLKTLPRDLEDVRDNAPTLFWVQLHKIRLFSPGLVNYENQASQLHERDLYMDELAHSLLETRIVSSLRNTLSLWAIHRQDVAMLTGIVETGLSLPISFRMSRAGPYGGFGSTISPLLMALFSCQHVSFWDTLWASGSQFLTTGDDAMGLGYFELVCACASFREGGVHDVDKVRFLLTKGARVRYLYRDHTLNDAVITPLEVLLGQELRVPVGDWVVDTRNEAHKNVHSSTLRNIERINGLVHALLTRDADVNSSHPSRRSPLQIAAKCGNFYAMRLLVHHGADINVPTPNIEPNTNKDMKADPDNINNPLIRLCHEHRRWFWDAFDDGDADPKLRARRASELTVLEFLLTHGADVNFVSVMGTPLFLACLSKESRFLNLLRSAGVNVHMSWYDTEQCRYRTPLDKVLTRIPDEVGGLEREREAHHRANRALWLLDNGAELAPGSSEDDVLLDALRSRNWTRVVESFMRESNSEEQEAPPEATNDERLEDAIRAGNIDEARLAIEAGAMVCSPIPESNHGETPLHLAARRSSVGMALLLLEHNADAYQCTQGGQTPLSLAARIGDYDMTQLLLNVGAGKYARGQEHHHILKRAIDGAVRSSHTHVVRLLNQYR